jgi:soluble P-type ATPase
MFTLAVPEYGSLTLTHCVADYTGTLSVEGRLVPGVRDGLCGLAKLVDVHVLTSDTFGTARQELTGTPCTLHILTGEDHAGQKEAYVRQLGAEQVIALGNGNNDRLMLQAARIGVAVMLAEGCAGQALTAADILVHSPLDAFNLLLSPNRLKAVLRG